MTLAPQDHAVVAYWKVLKWSPEFWEQFCEQQRLVHEGVVPNQGMMATAREWGITIVELQHLLLEAGLVMDEADRRLKLADRITSLAEIAAEVAMDKFQNPEEVKDVELRHTASMVRTFSDAALNLKNGTAAPQVNIISAKEIKAIIQMSRDMPDVFVPLSLNEKEKAVSEKE